MHKDRALPLLGALQLLDMPGATATVAGWVAEHLDASDALRVRHMASQFHLTDLAERAAEYVLRTVVGVHLY